MELHFALWQHIPFVCIILPLASAAVTSVLKPRAARWWAMAVLLIVTGLSAVITGVYFAGAESYVFPMGHYYAPIGNEIRAGSLEALTALFFSAIMLLSLMGGMKKLDEHLDHNKQNLYYVILMLMPYQVTLVPNYLVADWLGILDTRWAIILPGIFSPFAVFILTKFMRRIPSTVIEAAKLDGAGEWQIFTKFCAPMSGGIVASVAILVSIDYWNMVEQPLVLLTGEAEALHPLSVFLSKINTGDAGVAFCVAAIYMIIPLLIFLYCEDYLVEGVSYSGGLKG